MRYLATCDNENVNDMKLSIHGCIVQGYMGHHIQTITAVNATDGSILMLPLLLQTFVSLKKMPINQALYSGSGCSYFFLYTLRDKYDG